MAIECVETKHWLAKPKTRIVEVGSEEKLDTTGHELLIFPDCPDMYIKTRSIKVTSPDTARYIVRDRAGVVHMDIPISGDNISRQTFEAIPALHDEFTGKSRFYRWVPNT